MKYLNLLIGLLLLSCKPGSGVVGQSKEPPLVLSVGQKTVAMVEGKEITEADLIAGLKGPSKAEFVRAKSEFNAVQKQALDDFLLDHLLGLEASKKGKEKDAYVKSVVDEKIKKVSDADVKKFYDDYSKQAGGKLPALEQVKGQIQNKLSQDNLVQRKQQVLAGLKSTYKVAYVESTVRLDVQTGDNPLKGSAQAPITVVEFSDFECPYCKRGADVIKELAQKYKGRVKIYFRDFPLNFHPRAKAASNAARCAGEQGKFWEMHDLLFAKQKDEGSWTKAPSQGEDPAAAANKVFIDYASQLKLDKAKFESCVNSNQYAAQIETDMQAGMSLGVNGTPAFFVNGIPMNPGARPIEEFNEIITSELAKTSQGASQSVLP